MSAKNATSSYLATKLREYAENLPQPGASSFMREGAKRLENQAQQILRLERSRADLRKFRERAFLDHWASKEVERVRRSNENLGRELARCRAQNEHSANEEEA